LRAGVLEDGIVTIEERGTGQGSAISPLLANVYLHYVFDLWAERWRRREATGDFAAQNCKKRGRSKPETFKFLGFVLICDKSRRGDFRVRRKSRRDRMCAKLREIKEELRQRTNRPIPETEKWLAQVVAGYFAYHAVPTNGLALSAFRYHVKHLWHRQLCRRSQRVRVLWTQMAKLVDEFLPKPQILKRGPACGSPSNTRGRSRVLELGSL
jgi:RNA-directed DNA polymerase